MKTKILDFGEDRQVPEFRDFYWFYVDGYYEVLGVPEDIGLNSEVLIKTSYRWIAKWMVFILKRHAR